MNILNFLVNIKSDEYSEHGEYGENRDLALFWLQ
jgi:hypothetical protein